MARQLRLAVAVTVLAATVLAGCSDTVSGTGQGSAAPTTSAPAPTTSSPTTSSAAPTPTSPTPTPTSSSSSSGNTVVPTALRRDPAGTLLGDPVTADYCSALGTDFLKPVGYAVVYAATQYLSGCFWRLRKGGQTQLDVSLYASPSSQLVPKPLTTYRTVNGQRVRVTPLDRTVGLCERDVFLASGTPTAIALQAFQIRIPKNSPKLCQAANLAASALAAKIRAKSIKQISLTRNTITDLDMCKVVEAGGITRADVLKGATLPYRRYFGAECLVLGTKVKAYFDTAVADPSVTQTSTPVKAGSHTVLSLNGNTNANCLYTSRQGLLPNGVTSETLEFQFISQSGKNVTGMCNAGKALIAKFLDTAGLK